MFDLLITFKDDSVLNLNKVAGYSISEEKILKVEKNGYYTFINFDEVKYVGRKFDLEE